MKFAAGQIFLRTGDEVRRLRIFINFRLQKSPYRIFQTISATPLSRIFSRKLIFQGKWLQKGSFQQVFTQICVAEKSAISSGGDFCSHKKWKKLFWRFLSPNESQISVCGETRSPEKNKSAKAAKLIGKQTNSGGRTHCQEKHEPLSGGPHRL